VTLGIKRNIQQQQGRQLLLGVGIRGSRRRAESKEAWAYHGRRESRGLRGHETGVASSWSMTSVDINDFECDGGITAQGYQHRLGLAVESDFLSLCDGVIWLSPR